MNLWLSLSYSDVFEAIGPVTFQRFGERFNRTIKVHGERFVCVEGDDGPMFGTTVSPDLALPLINEAATKYLLAGGCSIFRDISGTSAYDHGDRLVVSSDTDHDAALVAAVRREMERRSHCEK